MISILVCSRISGNKNFSLFNLLDSLKCMSSSHRNFEVLVKFDSDDEEVGKVLPKLKTYPFKIKHLIEPRGRGYIDLHIFYNRLFSIADERSVVVGAMGDDFEITQEGWDEIVLSKTNVFPDQIFIIHNYPHLAETRKNYQEQKFFLDFDLGRLDEVGIDPAPLWSRKLLDICGGFGHVSFTDAWTLCLEYFLCHKCGINRTIFLDQPVVRRSTRDDVDEPLSSRWWTDRAENFAFMRGRFYKTMVEQQARNIYYNIKVSELLTSDAPITQRESNFRAIMSAQASNQRQKYLTLSPISLLRKLRKAILNSFPPHMRPKLYRVIYPRLTFVRGLRKEK